MDKVTSSVMRSFTNKISTNSSSVTALLLLLLIAFGCSESVNQTETSRFSFDVSPKPTAVVTPDTAKSKNVLMGKVVGVSDGDTITVLDAGKKQHKIRLQGIDSPESSQPFGTKAKQNLSALIFGKTVRVVVHKRDRYNREVGTVYLGDTDVNLEQVKAGLAWHYKEYQSEQTETERRLYSQAETAARSSREGLWSEANPISPADWRSGKRTVTAKTNSSPAGNLTVEDETAPTTRDTRSAQVYVTRTGDKYHRAGCRYLSRSQIPISLDEAKSSYDACSVCKPPR
jgi:endonuclease YncB( thermonuclease family)